jgi:hypothetical protein
VQCLPPTAFEPNCTAPVGNGCSSASAAPGWCAQGTGGGGAGGGGGKAGGGGINGGAGGMPGATRIWKIDDFEDGDGTSNLVFGAKGAWYVANDCSGSQFPLPCVFPSPTAGWATHAAGLSMRTYGSGFQPGGYAQLGVAFRSNAPACDGGIDAALADGVIFWARSEGTFTVRFSISTAATTPVADGGTCSSQCSDAHGVYLTMGPEWRVHVVWFSDLRQEGWGAVAPFDPSTISNFIWDALNPAPPPTQASCFDFTLDDVAFFSGL